MDNDNDEDDLPSGPESGEGPPPPPEPLENEGNSQKETLPPEEQAKLGQSPDVARNSLQATASQSNENGPIGNARTNPQLNIPSGLSELEPSKIIESAAAIEQPAQEDIKIAFPEKKTGASRALVNDIEDVVHKASVDAAAQTANMNLAAQSLRDQSDLQKQAHENALALAAQRERVNQQIQDGMQKHMDNLERLNDEVYRARNEKIDPNHWWNSKGEGQQVAATLAALCFGWAGTYKDYAQSIDAAINRDIEVQKSNRDFKMNSLSKAQAGEANLYEMAEKLGMQKNQAIQATRIAMYEDLNHQLDAIKNGASSDIVKNNAQAAQDGIKGTIAEEKQKFTKGALANELTQAEINLKYAQSSMAGNALKKEKSVNQLQDKLTRQEQGLQRLEDAKAKWLGFSSSIKDKVKGILPDQAGDQWEAMRGQLAIDLERNMAAIRPTAYGTKAYQKALPTKYTLINTGTAGLDSLIREFQDNINATRQQIIREGGTLEQAPQNKPMTINFQAASPVSEAKTTTRETNEGSSMGQEAAGGGSGYNPGVP